MVWYSLLWYYTMIFFSLFFISPTPLFTLSRSPLKVQHHINSAHNIIHTHKAHRLC